MGKNQIRLTQDEIREIISEAVRNYDILGNPKYPEGVFSTDSEEGEALKDYAKSYEKPKGDDVIWNQRERKLKDAEDNVTGAKWDDTVNSLWDTDKKLDKMARDEFGDEEREGQLYDKPFGDLDDAENQWKDEPGYEEDDDDEDIAGINEGKVTLTEEGLRDFVSYSVARLLKEAYRPIYRNLGDGDYDYDGDEYVGGPNSHGNTEIEFSNGAVLYALEEVAGVELNDQYKQEFLSKYGKEPSEDDFINDMAKRIGFGLAVDVYIDFDVTEDPGDYWTQGYTYVDINSWEIDDKSPEYAQASDMGKKIMNKATEYEIEGNADELYDRLNEEVNKGAFTHFDGKSPYEPENPYKGMTWDEYCETKRMEHEKDQMKSKKPKEENPNHGTAIHFSGKKRETTPDDIEGYKHAFDNQYWVNKMNLSKDELAEMIGDCVKKLTEEMGMNSEPSSFS